MTQKRKSRGFSTFGFSTILLSFVMIGVVIFSALSVITAYSDYKLSKKVADSTTNYFHAKTQAYECIATLDLQLSEAYFSSENQTDYYSKVKNIVSNYGDYSSHNHTLTLEYPISEKQYFRANLMINYPLNSKDNFYEITAWNSVQISDIPIEEPLDLFH